jgi:hypothetical protein
VESTELVRFGWHGALAGEELVRFGTELEYYRLCGLGCGPIAGSRGGWSMADMLKVLVKTLFNLLFLSCGAVGEGRRGREARVQRIPP